MLADNLNSDNTDESRPRRRLRGSLPQLTGR